MIHIPVVKPPESLSVETSLVVVVSAYAVVTSLDASSCEVVSAVAVVLEELGEE